MLSRIMNKIRTLVGDLLTDNTDYFVYGSSATFTLSESNIESVSEVLINGEALGSGESYSFDDDNNRVTVSATLYANDVVSIKYNYYPQYSDTELKSYIDGAFTYISNYGIENFRFDDDKSEIYPYPSEKQENLIALVTAILMKPNYTRYRTATVNIEYPRSKSIEEKIEETITRYKTGSHNFFEVV